MIEGLLERPCEVEIVRLVPRRRAAVAKHPQHVDQGDGRREQHRLSGSGPLGPPAVSGSEARAPALVSWGYRWPIIVSDRGLRLQGARGRRCLVSQGAPPEQPGSERLSASA